MPQRIRDFGVAVLALAAVFIALALIDERVPEYVRGLSADITNGRAFQPGAPLGAITAVMYGAAFDNAFAVAMAVAGVVLLLLMVRT
jgi:hypothetical protein